MKINKPVFFNKSENKAEESSVDKKLPQLSYTYMKIALTVGLLVFIVLDMTNEIGRAHV